MRTLYFLGLVALAAACGSEAGAGFQSPAKPAESGPPGTTDGTKPSDGGPPGEPGTSCAPPTVAQCTAAPPFVGPQREWRNGKPALGIGSANHRGRDLFVNPGSPQWVIGNFAYGKALAEVKVKGEDVDIWLNRDCGNAWDKIGTVQTTDTPTHGTIEGIDDEPGRMFFQIPENKTLSIGRHRIRLVMAADLSWTELFIEVVSPKTPMFVTDVDGTLTTSENVEFTSMLTGSLSPANDGAADALTALSLRGYRPMYVTARPEWLVERTRDFVRDRGFPPGIIHTTAAGGLPATGDAAVQFKSNELSMLDDKGLTPAWVIGNTATDAQAYDNASIQPVAHRLFFQFGEFDGGQIFGGRRFESYATLVGEFKGLPSVCP